MIQKKIVQSLPTFRHSDDYPAGSKMMGWEITEIGEGFGLEDAPGFPLRKIRARVIEL